MYNPHEYKEGDWHCQAVMGIEEVRILYATLDKFLKDDDVPEDPLNWAQSQVASVPTLHWTGKTYSIKDGLQFAKKFRFVQDKADKIKNKNKRSAV